jgi:hypothetical protein
MIRISAATAPAATTAALIAAAMIIAPAPAHAQASPGETLEALYDVISGPVGEARDWERFQSLFVEGARMTVVVPSQDGPRLVTLSPDDYVERSGENLVSIGFTEVETRRQTFLYGEMATILSAYEGVRADTGETIAVGINTLVIVQEGDAWKIASIAWRAADEAWPVERGFEPVE